MIKMFNKDKLCLIDKSSEIESMDMIKHITDSIIDAKNAGYHLFYLCKNKWSMLKLIINKIGENEMVINYYLIR